MLCPADLCRPPSPSLSMNLSQVVALNLRSAGRVDQEAIAEDKEMDYPRILNRALPPEIRVLGWAAAPPEFNARCGGWTTA